MLLYDIKPRWSDEFASLSSIHPPGRDSRVGCPKCYLPIHRERTGPYTVQWDPGSDVVPDFIFRGGGDDILVSDRVKVAFEQAGLKGFVAWPLKIQEPKRAPKHSRIRRVPSPYTGPTVWDLYVTDYVHLIPERSTFEFMGICPKCGQKQYNPYGRPDQHWFVVDRSTWTGVDFMRPHELNTILLTEKVIDIVRAHGFTNARIHQLGEIGEPGPTPPSEYRMRDMEWNHQKDAEVLPQFNAFIERFYAHIEKRTGVDIRQAAAQYEAIRQARGQVAVQEEKPDINYDDLKQLAPSYPRLEDDSAKSCPVSMREILRYLRTEAGDDTLRSRDLKFIRTARIEDKDYWIWRFEEQDGTEAYVTVSRRPDGSTCVGYNSNDFGLTPEQFIYGDYQEVF